MKHIATVYGLNVDDNGDPRCERIECNRAHRPLYMFYPLGEFTQCPLSLVEWPGHLPTAELGDMVVDLLLRGSTVEFSRRGIWGVEARAE